MLYCTRPQSTVFGDVFCKFKLRSWYNILRAATIAKQISERTCFHTGKGNFFVIEILDDQLGWYQFPGGGVHSFRYPVHTLRW